MSSYTSQPPLSFRPEHVRGNWHQRFKNVRMARPHGVMRRAIGHGLIQGRIEIDLANASNSRAILVHDQTGNIVDTTSITNGAYLFKDLRPGPYAIIIIDGLGRKRGKVIHTVVP